MTRSDPRDVASAAARGVVWAFVATIVSRLSWVIALAFLARLLSPATFGLFAFGLVVILYVETVGDLGAGAALIYAPERVEGVAEVVFALNLGMGIVWFGLTQLAAPAVASFFRDPAAEPVLRMLAFAFLFKALGNTHDALCRKQLRFRARVVPEAAMALGKAVTAVSLAVAGLGVWSLVYGQLAGLALWVVALWVVVPWRPRLSLAPELVPGVVRYGRWIVAVNVLAAVVHHADLVVIGRFLGASTLGIYQIATKVPEATVTVAIWVTGHVLFPTFARIHAGGEDLGRTYREALRWVSLLTVPAAVGLFVVAEPLILTLFGDAWRDAVPITRALAVYAGLRSLGSHAGDVLKATGRTGLLAALAVVKAAVLVPLLVVAATRSALAVAMAMTAVAALGASLNVGVVCRLEAIRLLALARGVSVAVVASAVMGGVVWGTGSLGSGLAPPVLLAVQVIVGIALYLAVVLAMAPELVSTALAKLRGTVTKAGGET